MLKETVVLIPTGSTSKLSFTEKKTNKLDPVERVLTQKADRKLMSWFICSLNFKNKSIGIDSKKCFFFRISRSYHLQKVLSLLLPIASAEQPQRDC